MTECSIPTLLPIPRLKKRLIENVQKYMETSKKDRHHFPHHNFVPNALKLNQLARTTVIQLFRTSSPFTLEVAFGHTVKDTLNIHVVDGRANIRCSREAENSIIDTEAKFTSSWSISKDLLDHYRITLRPLKWPLLLVMEEIHPEAPSPFLNIPVSKQPFFAPDRTDNQHYAFIAARFAYMEERILPLSITVLGNDAEILMNTIVCPREFVKHYAEDTHNLKEDDIMRGLDHYIAYPLLKAILQNKTVVAYNVEKLLHGLQISPSDIHIAIDIKNLVPTTTHYTEFRLRNLAKMYLPTSEQPNFPIKITMTEASTIQSIFKAIKSQFIITTSVKNPYSQLINNIKDQKTSTQQFKLPDVPRISKTIFNHERNVAGPSHRRRSPPQLEEDQYPPKHRKVLRQEDLFAELDDRQINKQDTRTVIICESTAPQNKETKVKFLQRPEKTKGSIKPPTPIKDINSKETVPHPEPKKLPEQQKLDSTTPKQKDILPATRPVGPQNYLQHPFTLMGLVELNTESFLKNLETSAMKKESCTSSQIPTPLLTAKDDPAEGKFKKIKEYLEKREAKNPDPGTSTVIPNGHYVRATSDYDDSRYTWDYFIYLQYYDSDYPKSLTYNNIPTMPKMPDCGIMEILYIPSRYRGYPAKNLHLISSYVTREYRDARKIRTYSLFTRTVQPPLIS